jgi:methylmalonyl-CoA mutase
MTDIQEHTFEYWKALIQKEVKERSYENLVVHPEPGITLAPAYIEQSIGQPIQLSKARPGNTWDTGEYLHIRNAGEFSTACPTAIEGGAQAFFVEVPSGVHLQWIDVQLTGMDTPMPWYMVGAHHDLKSVTGIYDALVRQGQDFMLTTGGVLFHQASVAEHVIRNFPGVRAGGIDLQNTSANTHSILQGLQAAEDFLTQPAFEKYPAKFLATQLWWYVSIGDDFIGEISRLRAIRLCHAHLMQALQITDVVPPHICAVVENDGAQEDDHLVLATLRSVAAVAGGCDVLVHKPHQQSTYSATNYQRWLRNISHILKHEAHLDDIMDPVAGSYLIDSYTHQLAQKAWNTFAGISV